MVTINIDIGDLASLKEFQDIAKSVCDEASRNLAAMTHAKMVELASERLHSRRQNFIDALTLKEEDGVMIISLDASQRWVDDGMEPHSMLENLLKSPKAHRAKDGSVYVVVPFEHGPGKGVTNSPASTQDVVSTVKAEMKRRKIPWSKVERDDQGRPKLGQLHRFSIEHSPLKTHEGPGQGRGPIGDVKQGPNVRQRVGGGPSGGGIPFLRGVAVYQKAMDGGGVKRSVMTFRIASSKMTGEDIWKHPGLEPVHIFDDAFRWAEEQVESVIVPQLIQKLVDSM